MLESLKPLLNQRNKIGYIAARNTRILNDTLTEYFQFKQKLIREYGDVDVDENGNKLQTISINPNSPNFEEFITEFEKIKNIEHDVELMTMSYDEVIGVLTGEEILNLDWMLTD